jgi:hypothetical protein
MFDKTGVYKLGKTALSKELQHGGEIDLMLYYGLKVVLVG